MNDEHEYTLHPFDEREFRARYEVMLALPYLIVILALALSGRNVPYPGAYLKAYRRS